MRLANASIWMAGSTLIKIGVGLLVIKILALKFGPEGVGLAGNFRQLITVLGVMAGAGIFNGITKYIAEYHEQPESLQRVIGTATSIVVVFSGIIAGIFWFNAETLSLLLFNTPVYQTLIQQVAIIQFAIAGSNLLLAIFRGYQDARATALTVIGGSCLGVVVYSGCLWFWHYHGALLGLALIPGLSLIPALVLLVKYYRVLLGYLRFRWDRIMALQLGRFALMAVITCITLPVVYIIMRNLLAEQYSWQEVGLWQGMTTISDAYLQFVTASFTVYLLPTLSRLECKQAITTEILRVLTFILPVLLLISLMIWLLRDVVIYLLFSADFTPMRELFAWQLTGDIFKVAAYVFGYLIIARASLRWYLLAEVCQFILLYSLSYWLIPQYGALGAVQSYMLSYLLYFAIVSSAFICYRRSRA